jgi:hypothetical protein
MPESGPFQPLMARDAEKREVIAFGAKNALDGSRF